MTLGHNDVIIGDPGSLKSIWIFRSEVIKYKALDEKRNAVRDLPIFVFELQDMFWACKKINGMILYTTGDFMELKMRMLRFVKIHLFWTDFDGVVLPVNN